MSRPRKHYLLARFLGATIVAASALLLTLVVAASFKPEELGALLGRFLTSPGAAIIAASIAATAILVQLSHTRSQDKATNWWTNFEWAAERAVPSRNENRALPVALSINILNAMQDSAESELQKRACGGLVTLLTESMTEDSSPTHDDVTSNSSQSEIAEAISDYVAATSRSSARSRGAETFLHADLYARQVIGTLSHLVRQGRILRRRAGVHQNNGAKGFDDEVTIDGVDILVEVKYFDLKNHQLSRRIRDVRHKGRLIAPSQPLLLVNPVESRVGMDRETDGPPFAVMKWNMEDGADALEAALTALAEAAKENPLPKGAN